MIFTKEFLNNMNYKARLIRKLEEAKIHNPGKYSTLAREYNINPQRFNTLPVKELREIVGVLEEGK
jgi:hypothetical protein